MTTKIYSLQDDCGNIRYIGKTSRSLKERFSAHLLEARNGTKNHRCNWIRSVIVRGKWPSIFLIGEVGGQGCKEEIAWIAYFRAEGIKLVNETDGGEGATGHFHTEESKRKMSLARKGILFSEEHKRKIGESNKGYRKCLGHHHSKISLLKMSNAQKGHRGYFLGRHHSIETKAKMSASGKGRIFSEEHKKRISESHKGLSVWNEGKHHSEETRAKIGLAQRNYQQRRKQLLNSEARHEHTSRTNR